MRRLILGTAGHIDHGKTSLVRALTGVETDRLKEEKERGITIELGFAEFVPDEDGDLRFGVVDVPGHEGFIRNMLAGATGMDVVLLVVAADEGVMPQTREHVDIVRMLGVQQLVVALTKADLVEPDWLELAVEDVRDFLSDGPYADAPVVPTSSETGAGLDELCAELVQAAGRSAPRGTDDLVRLPVDRVFTVKGTGTVVTGTLWTGELKDGASFRLLPDGPSGRIRGLQVHGVDADRAQAGQRTAVALAGAGVDREDVERGHTVVTSEAWRSSLMLTARVAVLPETGWELRHGQRVRVHLGTAEVLSRVAVLGDVDALGPGDEGWIQFRLEAPLVARGRDRLVVRSYSPVTTIAGGVVAEPSPPKRKRLTPELEGLLVETVDGGALDTVAAHLTLRGGEGATAAELEVLTGERSGRVADALQELVSAGARDLGGRFYAAAWVEAGRSALESRLEEFHAAEPLRPGLPLEQLRQTLPQVEPRVVDALLAEMAEAGVVELTGGVARSASFRPELTAAQEEAAERLRGLYAEAGLAPPAVDELPDLGVGEQLWPLLKLLEGQGDLVSLTDEYFVDSGLLAGAVGAVRTQLAGQTDLGPADFREVLDVTRKHLIPLLGYLDRIGVTVRSANGRAVEN